MDQQLIWMSILMTSLWITAFSLTVYALVAK